MRTTLLDLRRQAVLGIALVGALAGCGLDFKVTVGGIPADSTVNELLVSFDSDGRRADAAMPVDIKKFAVESRKITADHPDPIFTFALDATGLSQVSATSRISVAAISTSGTGAPKCLRVTGTTQAALADPNPSFVDIRVDLLPQVVGTQQVPSAMPGCDVAGPILLGVRRELSGPLDQSKIRFFLNGWNFGIKNKVTVRRCDPAFAPKQGATCEVPPRCISPMVNCCTPKDLAITCAVNGSSPPIADMYFGVESVGKAEIVLTVKPGIFTNNTDGFLNLLAFPFPLHFTVEPQDAMGTPTGTNATYVEPQQQILTM